MFAYSQNFNQPLENWNVSGCDLSFMFAYAKSFNQPLHTWDVRGVWAMQGMFAGTQNFNQPLSSWDVSSVEYMRAMFRHARAFRQNLESWNVGERTNVVDIFDESYGELPNWAKRTREGVFSPWFFSLDAGYITTYCEIYFVGRRNEVESKVLKE